MSVLTKQQTITLARGILKMLPQIEEFFKDPENEREFQEWYREKYNKPAPSENCGIKSKKEGTKT